MKLKKINNEIVKPMKTPNASNANNYAYYSFAIVSRTLHMGKDGTYWL